jgi:YHS domain-containing protein
VAAHARAGQILCTKIVVDRAGGLGGVEHRPLGEVRFKNVVDPVPLFEVVAGVQPAEPTAIDPLCRMQVRPATAAGQLAYGGRTYSFCSLDCVRAFMARPDGYAG